MYPRLKCIVENFKSGHQKYYPLELIEIYKEQEDEERECPGCSASVDENKKLVIDEDNDNYDISCKPLYQQNITLASRYANWPWN